MEWKNGDIDGVEVVELKMYEDVRGYLIETYRSDEIPGGVKPTMSYISVTQPGKSRGPHEHVHQTDVFSFPGPGDFKLSLWDNRPGSLTYGNSREYKLGEARPATVIVPPGVVHGYSNVSEKPAMVLNYPDKLYRGEGKREEVDEIRHEDEADSPFRL